MGRPYLLVGLSQGHAQGRLMDVTWAISLRLSSCQKWEKVDWRAVSFFSV